MVKFVGCKEAKEVSATRKGANPLAFNFFTKSQDTPAAPPTPAAAEANKTNPNPPAENDIMSIKNLQRIATMSDVTKSYFAGLDDKAAETFIAKSVEDQDKEAAEAAKTIEAAKTAAAAREAGVSEREMATQKALETTQTQLAEVLKRLDAQTQTASIEKMARDPEFDGFPGGTEAVTKALTDLQALPEEARAGFIATMKSQAGMAKKMAGVFGRTVDASKAAPANAQLMEMAKTLATEKKISEGDAYEIVIEKAENAELVARANAEQN